MACALGVRHFWQFNPLLSFFGNLFHTSTGSPQGCVLSPLLYILFTDDCRSTQPNCYLVKFADNTVLLSLFSAPILHHTSALQDFVTWCEGACLQLSSNKTKEVIVTFSSKERQLAEAVTTTIRGDPLELWRSTGTWAQFSTAFWGFPPTLRRSSINVIRDNICSGSWNLLELIKTFSCPFTIPSARMCSPSHSPAGFIWSGGKTGCAYSPSPTVNSCTLHMILCCVWCPVCPSMLLLSVPFNCPSGTNKVFWIELNWIELEELEREILCLKKRLSSK